MNSTAAIHSQPVDPGILKRRLTRATRRARMTAFLLALPLLAFITLSFALPIGSMLLRSIHNPTFPDTATAEESAEATVAERAARRVAKSQ